MKHEPGDMLLFALSAWKETSWVRFKKVFDEIYRIHLKTEKISNPHPIRYERARALRALVTLGHCDVDTTGSLTVTIGIPAFASLPSTGLPRAVLCGSRSPATVKLLQQICSESRQSLRLIQDNQRRRGVYAPLRVEVEAESYVALKQAAETLGVAFTGTPQCWVLSAACGSLGEYATQLQWSLQSEVNWEREDFDPDGFVFRPVPLGIASTNGIRLSRYHNPTRMQWEYGLVEGGRITSVRADWGRYIILNAKDRNSLLYDKKLGSLAVARGAPLPGLIARALVLCSGYVSTTVTARVIRSSIREQYAFDVYIGIPQDVLSVLAKKLGQREPIEPLLIGENTQ